MSLEPSIRHLFEDAAPRHRTASAAVAEALRKAIFEGLIAGGSRLRQDDIAEFLGVSRMPIREAIRLLEADGLVIFEPHRGAVVSTLSVADVVEISELRVTLECLALGLSLPNLTEADLDRAEQILDQSRLASSPTEQTRLNKEFHYLLYSTSGRRRLQQQIEGLHGAYERYLRIEHGVLSYDQQTDKDHRRILDACRRRNVDVAVAEMKGHISLASACLVEMLEQSQFGKTDAQSATPISDPIFRPID